MTDIVERLRNPTDIWPWRQTLELANDAADEIARLRAVATELHDALGEVILWYSSGFAPQSQAVALRKANEAMANYRALEHKP